MTARRPGHFDRRRTGLPQLIARWQRRAEYLRAQAAHASADGRDGEAIRLEQAAELYEQVAEEAAHLAETPDD